MLAAGHETVGEHIAQESRRALRGGNRRAAFPPIRQPQRQFFGGDGRKQHRLHAHTLATPRINRRVRLHLQLRNCRFHVVHITRSPTRIQPVFQLVPAPHIGANAVVEFVVITSLCYAFAHDKSQKKHQKEKFSSFHFQCFIFIIFSAKIMLQYLSRRDIRGQNLHHSPIQSY